MIISAAAGDRSEFAGAIKNFENNPRVISEPANNANIDFGEISETPHPQLLHNIVQLHAFAASLENFKDRFRQFAQSLFCFLTRLTFRFINRLQHLFPAIRWDFLELQQFGPELAVANADDEILRGESKRAHDIDGERDQLRVSFRRLFAYNIAVQLKVLT